MTGTTLPLKDVESFVKKQILPEMARFTIKGNTFFLYAFLRARPSINIMLDATNHISENPRNVAIFMQSYSDNVLNAEPYVAEINEARKKFIQLAINNKVPIFNVKEQAIAYVLEKLESVL